MDNKVDAIVDSFGACPHPKLGDNLLDVRWDKPHLDGLPGGGGDLSALPIHFRESTVRNPRPHHILAAVIPYALFKEAVQPGLIAAAAGLLYLDERRGPLPALPPGSMK